MALITSTETLKLYINGFNKQTNINTMMAWLDKAERKFLIPVIGQEMYEYLLTAGDDTELCQIAQRVVAWYGYYLSLPHLNITPSDLGLKVNVSANTAELPKWKYTELLRSSADMADDEMEDLLGYLFGQVDIPQWENSEAAKHCKSTFFTSALRLTMVVPMVKGRYRTFLELYPYLMNAQDKLEPILTSELLQRIREVNELNGKSFEYTGYEADLLSYCRKVIAPMAALDALVDSKLKLYPDGLKTTTYEDAFGQQPTGTQERIITEQQEKLKKQMIEAQTALKAFLDRTASETIFPSYYQRKVATPKPQDLFLTNANQKSFIL
ncbi:hypothetical protein BWI93_10225 [Siphonobacter sp. BAB-5385]|uniref:DUF6712 family protein n=1 Tax=Siphonobacter sp. BAB-5385 TaxID=1864822 RepID=UPI000B9DE747|nr:DUF6712 family protein [Siphonobacter sp. BAB-5385]OZI08234.1 hypothetical protein BWI93_10225 [Siphonobacter sp. BAB-5385]